MKSLPLQIVSLNNPIPALPEARLCASFSHPSLSHLVTPNFYSTVSQRGLCNTPTSSLNINSLTWFQAFCCALRSFVSGRNGTCLHEQEWSTSHLELRFGAQHHKCTADDAGKPKGMRLCSFFKVQIKCYFFHKKKSSVIILGVH